MDRQLYEEMTRNLEKLDREQGLTGRQIFLFGHCSAAEELADMLLDRGQTPAGFLDNNGAKHGKTYRGIKILPPQEVLAREPEKTLVCTVARAHAAMTDQLKRMGYGGKVWKLLDYNSYAEYSFSWEVRTSRRQRAQEGAALLQKMARRHPNRLKGLCPFSALGDIYIMMSYLPEFLKKRDCKDCVIGVVGKACGEAAGLFGSCLVEVYSQEDMDRMIQGALFMRDRNVFIPHQDRPYVVDISRALGLKMIPLEQLYCCGVFGLPAVTQASRPTGREAAPGGGAGDSSQSSAAESTAEPSSQRNCTEHGRILPGRSAVLSPYAKSVPALPRGTWEKVVESLRKKGYRCYTNVAGAEKPLPGTKPLCLTVSEIREAVERAELFIGIRSGLCDVLREVSCRKIALYPDYNYCGTEWKAVDMYGLEGWENIVIKDGT